MQLMALSTYQIWMFCLTEIEEQVRNLQAKRQGLGSSAPGQDEEERVGLGTAGHYDQDIYGNGSLTMDSRFVGYDTSIAVTDEPDVRVWFCLFVCVCVCVCVSVIFSL